MSSMLARMRPLAGAVKRRLFPTPDVAAWRRATKMARRTPRFTTGQIQLGPYDLEYADLLSTCPMWHSIFIEGSLRFRAPTDRPRILDCGANIGLATLYFKRSFPNARITAYEADPAIFSTLQRNLGRNGAADVERVHAAVWTSAGDLTFHAEGSDSGMVASLPAAVRGRPVSVPSIRLHDVLAREPVDLLKLDIEGAEAVVLADCEPVLHRVGAIAMDLHEFEPAERQGPRVLELLSRAGFVYAVGELVPQPWRPPVAPAGAPFGPRALVWLMMVWAWRPEAS